MSADLAAQPFVCSSRAGLQGDKESQKGGFEGVSEHRSPAGRLLAYSDIRPSLKHTQAQVLPSLLPPPSPTNKFA